MFTEDPDYLDFVIGLVAAALVAAGVIAIGRNSEPEQPVSVDSVRLSLSDSLASTAIVEKKNVSSAQVIATVYECFVDGQRVLSDRPCAADAATREILEPNRMPAQDTSRLYEPVPGAPGHMRSGSSGPLGPTGNAALCDSIDAQIKIIDARMRRRYTNQEGENVRQRLRDLREDRWEAKCRWVRR